VTHSGLKIDHIACLNGLYKKLFPHFSSCRNPIYFQYASCMDMWMVDMSEFSLKNDGLHTQMTVLTSDNNF